MNKNNRLINIIVMSLAIVLMTSALASAAVDSNSDVKVKCKGAIVMDAKNGNVLYDKNGYERFYPASCTKLMTALVALENCDDLSKVVTVSHEAVYGIDPESSHIALEEGEKITMEQALYGLLLASANDAAVVIAEEVGGSIDGFADMMNKKAKELGLTGTHFVDPHGLYDANHYTTPRDLAKIMDACLDDPQFVKIFSTLKYTIPKTNKAKKRVLYNNHRMVKYKYAYHPAVIGGKSGYITKSGFNLVS
ncbi:MAG: D-alanyl-D-alanine carboxypeptidase family protein [Eubacteriaceae bacterium]|nr:D-alanyl-D-alanine carboxypeptidase family protein [Eubacteriaceae bacterium]